MKEKKKIIAIVIFIVVLIVCGIGGYMAFGMFAGQPEKKPVKAETAKEKEKEPAKEEEKEPQEEEEPAEPLEVTEAVQETLDDDFWFYDLNRRLSDGTETRQNYSVELSDNKISKDLLKYVANEIASGRHSMLGNISGENGSYSITLTQDECIDYLKNTFGYEVNDSDELAEIAEPDGQGGYRFSQNPYSGADDASMWYDCSYFVQTGKNEYHIYAEVKVMDDYGNTTTTGIMEVTAHRNDKSQIAGFVFDKIDFTAQNTGLWDVQGSSMTQVDAMLHAGIVNSMTGQFNVNSMSAEQFAQYVDECICVVGLSKKATVSSEQMEPYASISVNDYNEFCMNTLGRTEPFDVTATNEVNGDTVTCSVPAIGWDFGAKIQKVFKNLDGTVTVYGIINDLMLEGTGTAYGFTMTGVSSDASDTGMVLTDLNVTDPQ